MAYLVGRIEPLVRDLDTGPDYRGEPHNELRHVMEGVVAALGCSIARKVNRWHAYYPGDVVAIGTMHASSGRGIVTTSRNISNRRYSSYNSKHHTVASANVDTAVTNAKRYFRRYSTEELFRGFLTSGRDMWVQAARGMHVAYENKRQVITNSSMPRSVDRSRMPPHDSLYSELAALVALQHPFQDAEFGTNALEFVGIGQALRDDNNERNNGALFVVARPRRGDTAYSVLAVEDLTSTSTIGSGELSLEVYSPSALPEHIRARLATLMMCEENQFVDGVGVRVHEHCAFLYK